MISVFTTLVLLKINVVKTLITRFLIKFWQSNIEARITPALKKITIKYYSVSIETESIRKRRE